MDRKHEISSPQALLTIFDEGCGKYSKPLMSKDHSVVISPPVLLPGETLILQQDKVTCVNTLSYRATGALHLTNYRVIFTGVYMQKSNLNIDFTNDHFSKLGYRHQERKKFFTIVPSNIRKFVPGHKSRSLKYYRKSSKKDLKWTMNKLAAENEDYDDEEDSTPSESAAHGSLPNLKSINLDHVIALTKGRNSVEISLPILSLHDIKKFPRQYLENEKLQMLNDGIEIVTTNFLSVKFCLGEEGSYHSDELIIRLLKHSKVKNASSIFAYVHKRNLFLPKSCDILDDKDASNIFQIEKEMYRLQVGNSRDWKLTEQKVCEMYPSKVIVPFVVGGDDDDLLKKWAAFHVDYCFPTVVWRSLSTGNLLLRSSGTTRCRGDKDGRSAVDEDIVRSICSDKNGLSNKLYIFTDTPLSQTSNPVSTSSIEPIFYPNCEIVVWENLPDVCATQQSSKRLHAVLNKLDDSHYYTNIEETGYLQEINVLLDYAACVVAKLTKHSSHVLLSVGSGTERVAQLSSLVQLLMDPYYRTFNGFQILIQKEWCSMEYPFIKRTLIDFSTEDDLSPLFLQFLDCVWQITQQYPITFEFSEKLLALLAEHSYSGRFGTFLNEKPQINNNNSTVPIWPYINLLASIGHTLLNYNFDDSQHSQQTTEYRILKPRVDMAHLGIWSWYNQYKTDDALFISSMFGVMEMEKLQKEYHGMLVQYNSLLNNFSKVDEWSDIVTYNLRSSSSSPDLVSSSDETESTLSSYTSNSQIDDESLSIGSPVGNKWHSFDCLFSGDSESSKVSTYGSSLFYIPTDDHVPGNGASTLFSLHGYLVKKGIRLEDVSDPKISKMSCCGYLTKRGDVRKSWKKRWFVIDLKKKFVAYFVNPSAVNAKGVFNYVSIMSVYVDKSKESGNTFFVRTRGRTYRIKAPNERAMRIWMMCFSIPLNLVAT